MPLTDFLNDELAIMNKVSRPDNAGGYIWTWEEGVHFPGKAIRKSSDAILIAEQEGMNEIFTITTLHTIHLERGDYVKRIRDGAIFKVASDPMDATFIPDNSGVKSTMVYAERTTL